MNRRWLSFSISVFFVTGIILGFSFTSESLFNDDPNGARNYNSNNKISINRNQIFLSDNNSGNQTFGSVYYSDNFDGLNDTASLKSRGYKVYYRGGGTQGIAPVWFQGNLFPSYNGPSNGYVAANFQVVNNINNIDSWLVLPKKDVSSGDSIVFYARSDSASTYPDSIRVMYSAAGDSIPEASWTELGRFMANTAGVWERKVFGVNASGVNARFAIRYNVVKGGVNGSNSNYIGIDALTLETDKISNDISAATIISPNGNLILPISTISPKAIFTNTGTSNQTNISVTFKITGPVNYTSNKIISSLNSGASAQINFDSTFNPLEGNYSIVAYSSLLSDGNRHNDTVKLTFSVANPNYGSSASYFYANSTTGASTAPSQPQFCWKDTTGSVSLALNNQNSFPGISTGDLDDGYWKILIPSGKKVRFFGSNYDTVRIGTNGIISFQAFIPDSGNWNPPLSGIPGGSVLNAVYPLWCDFDFSNQTAGSAVNRISYKVAGSLLIITYDRAPVYLGTAGQYVSYQIAIDISTSPSANSRILIQYADTTGGKTGGAFINMVNNNTLGRHLIGLQNNTGTSSLTYRFRNAAAIITTGKIFNSPSGSLALQVGPNSTQLNSSCQTLNLISRLEAIQLERRDTLIVSLRENISPYPIIETKKIVYDSITGGSVVPFTLASNGSSYFVYVSHRNSISTWSSAPVLCTNNLINYNFTTGISQAYGNNMIFTGGNASFFTGEVERDGCIDLTDLVTVFNDASSFTAANYALTDVNWDGIVDLTDLVFTFNNTSLFICESAPPGAFLNSGDVTKSKNDYEKDIVPKMSMNKIEWIKKNKDF